MRIDTESLSSMAGFLERELFYFTGVVARREWDIFRNYVEDDYEFSKQFFENALKYFVDNVREGKVNTTMNLKEASQLFVVVDCRSVDKELRSALYTIVYSNFIRNLIDDIQKGNLDELTFEDGSGLMRMIESNMVEEDLRIQLRNFVYPMMIESLIDDIQQKKVDELLLMDVRRLIRIFKYDLIKDDLMRVQLCNFIYPRMIRTLINSIQKGELVVDEVSWGELKVIQFLIDSNVDPEHCSLLRSLFYDEDEKKLGEGFSSLRHPNPGIFVSGLFRKIKFEFFRNIQAF